jgi:hypothetical protein
MTDGLAYQGHAQNTTDDFTMTDTIGYADLLKRRSRVVLELTIAKCCFASWEHKHNDILIPSYF